MSLLAMITTVAIPFLASLASLLSPHFLGSTKLPREENSYNDVGYTSSLLGEWNNPKFSSSWQLAAITGVTTCILLFLASIITFKSLWQNTRIPYDNKMEIAVLFLISFFCSLTTIIAASNTNLCSHSGCENAMGIGFQYFCCTAVFVIGLSFGHCMLTESERQRRHVGWEPVLSPSPLEMESMDSPMSNSDPTEVLTATIVSTTSSHGMCPDKGHPLGTIELIETRFPDGTIQSIKTIVDKSGTQIVLSDTTNLTC
jgi:hypothetical protein